MFCLRSFCNQNKGIFKSFLSLSGLVFLSVHMCTANQYWWIITLDNSWFITHICYEWGIWGMSKLNWKLRSNQKALQWSHIVFSIMTQHQLFFISKVKFFLASRSMVVLPSPPHPTPPWARCPFNSFDLGPAGCPRWQIKHLAPVSFQKAMFSIPIGPLSFYDDALPLRLPWFSAAAAHWWRRTHGMFDWFRSLAPW